MSDSPGTYYYRTPSTSTGSYRSDGSQRPAERPPRPGYTLSGSAPVYVPPPKREEVAAEGQAEVAERVDSWADTNGNGNADSSEKISSSGNAQVTVQATQSIQSATTQRLDDFSWAEEDSPVIKKFESESEQEQSGNESSTGAILTETIISSTVNSTSTTGAAAPRREPSKLATAIDDALDTLSLDSGNSGATGTGERQIGRFAAQIRNEQRGDYSHRDYSRNERGYYQQRSTSTYERRPYNSNSSASGYTDARSNGYNNVSGYNNGTSNANNSYNVQSNPPTTSQSTSSQANPQSTRSPLSPSQSYGECPRLRSCLDSLSKYRRDMAIINAKLEYIRYMRAAKDEEDLTPVEKERVAQEAALLEKINSLYEQIEALEL